MYMIFLSRPSRHLGGVLGAAIALPPVTPEVGFAPWCLYPVFHSPLVKYCE